MKSTYEITRMGWSLTILLAYLSTLFVLPLHEIQHQAEQEEVCYEEDNACHQLLVHNNGEKGCNHKAHFTEALADCELCALLEIVPDKTITPEKDLVVGFIDSFNLSQIAESPYSLFPNFRYKRGPPLNS